MNELKAIAETNEEIKSIMHAAESISLTATNAILLANQAGANAVGFSVVARELRMFSEKMATAMQGLSELIYRQVVATAGKRHRVRNVDLLNKAGSYGGLAETRIAAACVRSQVQVDERERLIASLMYELQVTMKRIEKQCATGLVIARSAGIEAAHGGSMMESLRLIAVIVSEVTDNIFMRVKKLESRLTEAGL
jgi:DNA-directed RNA polymerase specialized sigma subunit